MVTKRRIKGEETFIFFILFVTIRGVAPEKKDTLRKENIRILDAPCYYFIRRLLLCISRCVSKFSKKKRKIQDPKTELTLIRCQFKFIQLQNVEGNKNKKNLLTKLEFLLQHFLHSQSDRHLWEEQNKQTNTFSIDNNPR